MNDGLWFQTVGLSSGHEHWTSSSRDMGFVSAGMVERGLGRAAGHKSQQTTTTTKNGNNNSSHDAAPRALICQMVAQQDTSKR